MAEGGTESVCSGECSIVSTLQLSDEIIKKQHCELRYSITTKSVPRSAVHAYVKRILLRKCSSCSRSHIFDHETMLIQLVRLNAFQNNWHALATINRKLSPASSENIKLPRIGGGRECNQRNKRKLKVKRPKRFSHNWAQECSHEPTLWHALLFRRKTNPDTHGLNKCTWKALPHVSNSICTSEIVLAPSEMAMWQEWTAEKKHCCWFKQG